MLRLRTIFRMGLFFLLLLLAVNPILEGNEEAVNEEVDVAKLIVGETKVFSTRAPTRVVIGNPAIADIADVTNTEISVAAKSPGSTNLIFWDAFGEQSIKIRVVAEDMNEIKRRVDNLLSQLNYPGVYTKAEDEEGKVLILGNVKTPQDRERINLAFATLKDKIVDLLNIKEEEAVVEIDVQVLEVDKGSTDALGFTWPGALNLIEKGSPGIGAAGARFDLLFKLLNLQRGTAAGVDPYVFKLDALIQEGKARILSRPRLACQSGKEAQMLVGGEKPTFTTSTTEGGTVSSTVEYKEYGIKLKVKPTVTEDNRIKLALNVEVSDVGESVTLGSSSAPTALAYPLTKRTASTELYLNDGQTLAIGGLIKQKTEEDLRKFPWLADVPVLGLFFRQRTTRTGGGYLAKTDTELFITLTPTIMSKKEAPTKEIKPEITSLPPLIESPTDPVAMYTVIIQKRILENLAYPASAKQSGFQGSVKLSLHLSYSGSLLDAVVKESSGYKILDDYAVSTAKRMASYPPFPPSIDAKDIWVDIPIVYKID